MLMHGRRICCVHECLINRSCTEKPYATAIPLLRSHAEFLVERYTHFISSNDGADADAFSAPWTRMMLKSVMTRAMKDISKVRTHIMSISAQ